MPPPGPAPQPRINPDATVDEHLVAIRSQRHNYLARTLKQKLPSHTRHAILDACLLYLSNRNRQPTVTANNSQSLSQGAAPLSQATVSQPSPDSEFHSLLTTLIEQDIPHQALIKLCSVAVDLQILPLVAKALAILATLGSVSTTGVGSQSQYNEQEIQSAILRDPNDLMAKPPTQPPGAPPDPTQPNNAIRTGQHFVDQFVSNLVENCANRRANMPSLDVFVVSLAREAPLSEHTAQQVLHQLIRHLQRVGIFELPAFIYQLLLFTSARARPAVKSRVLLHVADTCTQHEQNARRSDAVSQSILEEDEDAIVVAHTTLKDVRIVQGTALLHIEYAVKQDPSLPNEIIKLAKSGVENPKQLFNSFGMGILLSLTHSTAIQTDVLQLLRDTIVRFDKEKSLREKNIFASRVTHSDPAIHDIRKSLLYIADSTCENGWDYVKESLLHFTFVLLDKPLPEQSAASKGSLVAQLLVQLFKSHPPMREVILENLTTRIALQEKSAFQSVVIIREFCEVVPMYVLEHHRFIRDGIDLLVTLPPWLATTLINAYEPLFKKRLDLKDSFLLVVRKSLFHRDTASRAVSILGFLHVLSFSVRDTRQANGSTSNNAPTSVSQQTEEELDSVMETVQPLRRVLSYPAPLKAFWYKSVIDHLQNAGTEKEQQILASALSGILLPHLQKFIDAGTAPYLLLDRCVNESNGSLDEPLGELISCLASIESRRAPSEYRDSYVINFAEKIASVSLQDFAVAKEPLVSASTDQSQTQGGGDNPQDDSARINRIKVRVLGGVTEALIHAMFLISNDQLQWRMVSETVVPLLLLKGKLVDLLQSAKVATPGDAFRDLGGILGIERLRAGARLVYQRAPKASSGKTSGRKKNSEKATAEDQTPGQGRSFDHRFGVFSVLTSSLSKPNLSFEICVKLLDQINQVLSNKGDEDNVFYGHGESQDLNELKAYLLTLAQKHIDDFTQGFSKTNVDEPSKSPEELERVCEYVQAIATISMAEFKRHRRTSGDAPGHGGIKALEVTESCTNALRFSSGGDVGPISSFCKALVPGSSNSLLEDQESSFEPAVGALEKLIETLIEDGMLKEVIVVLRIHDVLLNCVLDVTNDLAAKEDLLVKRGEWAVGVLTNAPISDPGIVKSVARICLTYTKNNNDLRNANEVSERLVEVIGYCDTGTEPPEISEVEVGPLMKAEAISQNTCFAVVDGALDAIDLALNDVEWCIGRMVSLESTQALLTDPDSDPAKDSAEEAKMHKNLAKLAIRAEDAAQTRLEGVLKALRGLTRCAIAKWSQQERLLRLVTRAYKNLCAATQAQLKRRANADPRTSLTSLIDESKSLSPVLWSYLGFLGSKSAEEVSGKGKSKAVKEARVMPQLVYEAERFEKVLIAVQKRTKVQLLRGMRRNIARDFRIREERIRPEDEEDHEVPEDGPDPKRRRAG